MSVYTYVIAVWHLITSPVSLETDCLSVEGAFYRAQDGGSALFIWTALPSTNTPDDSAHVFISLNGGILWFQTQIMPSGFVSNSMWSR